MADDPLAAGLPSYVMQEEFDRYQGYWWQPYSNGRIMILNDLWEMVIDDFLMICFFQERFTEFYTKKLTKVKLKYTIFLPQIPTGWVILNSIGAKL